MKNLEERVAKLESRNIRVENEKSWETSWTRRLAIAILTYLIVAAYMYFVVQINPWINAFVPVVGFLLSTLTINYLKSLWIKKVKDES